MKTQTPITTKQKAPMRQLPLPEPFRFNHGIAEDLLKAAIWFVMLYALYIAIFNPYVTQWDFKLYLSCAKGLGLGIDPYNETQMKLALGYYWDMPCLYSPLVLSAYRPFVAISPGLFEYGAQLAWSALKIAGIAALVGLWKLYFIDIKHNIFFLLYFALAYGSPFLVDIRAGNIAIFEQILLWTGFALLLRGHGALFASCIILAAQAKFTPILFLPLLLTGPKPRWGLFAAACAAFAATLFLNRVFWPNLTVSFLHQLQAGKNSWWNETGMLNCSSFAFLKDLAALAGPAARPLLWALLTAFVFSVLAVSGRAISRISNGRQAERIILLETAMFYCAAYALLMPRFKDYSYALMLAPTAYILDKIESERIKYGLLFFLFANSAKTWALRIGFGVFADFFSYFKLYAAFLTWLAYLGYFKRRDDTPPHP